MNWINIKKLKYKLTHRTVCDSCGMVNPEMTTPTSRRTKCCADREDGCYGKPWTEKLQSPIQIKFRKLWTWT